jgi:Uma2 family endonuclease
MSLPPSEILYTVEEYLEMERAAAERHEYFDGYVYAMAGKSEPHGDICMNLSGLLHPQLRGTPCRGRIANTKVLSGPAPLSARSRKGLFSYPDFFVVCGEVQYLDKHQDVVTNPKVIFEVLSDSTEEFDRDLKFQRYDQWNPTLQDYLLISQSTPKIEHFTRQADGSWKYRVYRGLKASFVIESINCRLRLADLYERVVFPPSKAQLAALPKPPKRAATRQPATSPLRRKKQ